MEWERLREKVLEENYPEERELEELEEKYQQISDYIRKEFERETHLAGSASRGTCMKDDKDIDIFILFPDEMDEKELEDSGLSIGKSVFEEFDGNLKIEYAEHPYVKGEIDGYEVEIVPCYDTDPENIKSSVDRTPHHSRWVKQNLTDRQRKDVVILKKFLASADLYGSSLRTRGFSGYLCEILIHQYGSFRELIRSVSGWNEKKVIDPEGHHKTIPESLERKFDSEPLVVIDPVDSERNVAAVLSNENYSRFIFNCWRFRQGPGMHFFQDQERNYTEFEVKRELGRRADILVIEFERIEEVEDVVYPQMRKTVRRMTEELEKKGFKIYETGFHVDGYTRIFLELDRNLPDITEREGPKVFHGEEHLSEFTSKYDNVYIKEDTVTAKIEREYTDARDFIADFLEDDLQAKGIPKNVADKLKDYSFTDPLKDDREWLNYLGEKLHIQTQGEN